MRIASFWRGKSQEMAFAQTDRYKRFTSFEETPRLSAHPIQGKTETLNHA
jgi:hypothetical protein